MIADYRTALLDHPILDREEELRLLRTATQHESSRSRQRAAGRLAQHNMRLVWSIVRKYTPPNNMSHEHLFAVGLLGLYKAIQKFDVGRKLRLSTYATNWIRQAITREIEDFGHTIRIPSHMNQAIARENRVRAELSALTGNAPSEEELSEALGVKPKEISFYREVRTRCHANLSLNSPARAGDPDGPTLGDTLSSETNGPEDELPHLFDERHADTANLKRAIERLPPEHARIIRARYGLGDVPPKSLRELGEELGTSPERVRQKQFTATENLARQLIAARSRKLQAPMSG